MGLKEKLDKSCIRSGNLLIGSVAVQRIIPMVLGKLRSSEQASPDSALQIKALSDLANAVIPEGSALNGRVTDAAIASAPDLSKAAIALKEATAGQQMLLQQHRHTKEAMHQRCGRSCHSNTSLHIAARHHYPYAWTALHTCASCRNQSQGKPQGYCTSVLSVYSRCMPVMS